MADCEGKYNSDELVPLTFLTENYIQNILKTLEKDPDLRLINLSIKPGSNAGDHYASIMNRAIVSYETKGKIVTERRLILKTVPETEGVKKDYLAQLPLFKNELLMYTEILPAMEEILAKFGEKPWWPNLVHSSEEPLVLLFDDVTMENYRVQHKHLDMKEIPLIVDKIAKYHALSMVLIEQGKLNLIFDNLYSTEAIRGMIRPTTRHIRYLAELTKTWPGLEQVGPKILDKKIEERLLDEFLNSLTAKKDWGFNVLNHGDFHIRNLMFRKDQNQMEVLFLDFQVPILNSPACDLYSMLNATGNMEVRERKWEVLKSFHDKLVSSLRLYGYCGRLPTAIDVQVEMVKMSYIDAFQTLYHMPLVQFSGVEIGDMFNQEEGSPLDVLLVKLFKDPDFTEHMKKLLYSLENRGVFDGEEASVEM